MKNIIGIPKEDLVKFNLKRRKIQKILLNLKKRKIQKVLLNLLDQFNLKKCMMMTILPQLPI